MITVDSYNIDANINPFGNPDPNNIAFDKILEGEFANLR